MYNSVKHCLSQILQVIMIRRYWYVYYCAGAPNLVPDMQKLGATGCGNAFIMRLCASGDTSGHI